MSDATDAPPRADAILARLAELDLAAVERAHARMMAAETDAAFNDLGRTYQRLARSLRQTLAIKARLARERRADAAEARARAPKAPAMDRVDLDIADLSPKARTHFDQARASALRFIEREVEEEEHLDLCELEIIDSLLTLAEHDEDDFLATPVEEIVAALVAEMGFGPRADAPEPDRGPTAAPEPRDST